jgi:hypothetical protein
MATESRVLKAKDGVILTEHRLAGTTALDYTVKSRRTPEVPNFDSLAAAERHFSQEVERCRLKREV